MKLLVTGSTGFIGSILTRNLINEHDVIALTSNKKYSRILKEVIYYQYDLTEPLDSLESSFSDVEVIIHLASKVHDLSDKQNLHDYLNVNVEGTRKLLHAAKLNNVKRFIYISSIKVNGEGTKAGVSYKESDEFCPSDPYAISKMQCEELVKLFCEENNIEYTIIRPPLVYGPGVKANFLKLMIFVNKSLPLPMKSIKNRRSFIYVKNLCDAISICITHEAAKNQTFVIKDFTLSTPELIMKLAEVANKEIYLFSFPIDILKLIALLIGKVKLINRLTGSLEIDDTKIRKTLSWEPRFTLAEALSDTVNWYLKTKT